MLKKHQIISLLLLATLASGSCVTVSAAAEVDKNSTITLKEEAATPHDHDKGQSCPLKKGKSCPSARKARARMASKNPSWKERFFGTKDAKRDPATKPTPRARKAKAPSKSWWSFWGEGKESKKAAPTKEARTLKGQKTRRAMKEGDKKAGKKGGKSRKAHKGKKGKAGKKSRKSRKAHKGKKGKAGKKDKKAKKNKKNKKEKSDVIEVK